VVSTLPGKRFKRLLIQINALSDSFIKCEFFPPLGLETPDQPWPSGTSRARGDKCVRFGV